MKFDKLRVVGSVVRYWGWSVLVLIAGFLFYCATSAQGTHSKPLKISSDILRRKEKAEEEALKVRAETKVRTDLQKKKLEEISKVSEGRERRRRLAAFLKTV